MLIRKIDAQKPTVSKKLRVAAYCRVSTDQEDQKESLEAQKAHYESWIKRHSDWEFAGVFYDLGISGTKADSRDGLQALLYACRTGSVDYVLTKSVSRFSRNTTDCLSLVRELLSYNIPIYFEKENLDMKLSITLDTFPTRIMKRSVRRQPLRRIFAALQQEEAHQWTSRSCGCSSNS